MPSETAQPRSEHLSPEGLGGRRSLLSVSAPCELVHGRQTTEMGELRTDFLPTADTHSVPVGLPRTVRDRTCHGPRTLTRMSGADQLTSDRPGPREREQRIPHH